MRNDRYLSLFAAGRSRRKSKDKSDYYIHRRGRHADYNTSALDSAFGTDPQPINGLKCPAGKPNELLGRNQDAFGNKEQGNPGVLPVEMNRISPERHLETHSH